MENIKDMFCGILKYCERHGMEQLLEHLEVNGFFTAPCSGGNHLCKEGGLLEHSMNVYRYAIKLNMAFNANVDEHSLTICSLLHDVGKMGQFGKQNYVPNILKSGKQSESKPYETNKELLYEEHEIRSVIIVSKFIDLTEEEQSAILHHNGLYGKLDSSYGSYVDKTKLSYIIHMADMWASRFVEV